MSPPWWPPLQPLPTLKRTRRTLPLLLSSPGGASDRRHALPTPASSEPTLTGAPIHAAWPGARLPATQRNSSAVPLQQKPLQPRATGGPQPRAYLSRGLRPAAAPCFWRARFGRSASSPTNTALCFCGSCEPRRSGWSCWNKKKPRLPPSRTGINTARTGANAASI